MKKTIIFILCAIMLLPYFACSKTDGKKPQKDISIEFKNSAYIGMIDRDHNAHLTDLAGRDIMIQGSFQSAYISADRKRAITLGSDKALTVYNDLDDLDRNVVLTGNGLIYSIYIYEKGFVYYDAEEKDCYRYTFETGEKTSLGLSSYDRSSGDRSVCEKDFNLVYASDGKVYYLGKDESVPVSIGEYENEYCNFALSFDGKSVLFSDMNDGSLSNEKIFYYADGKTEEIGTLKHDGSFQSPFAFNRSGSIAAAYCGNKVFIISKGSEALEVKTHKSEFVETPFYTANGFFFHDDSKSFSELYLQIKDAFFRIDSDGEITQLVKDILYSHYTDGTLYYVDKNRDLYCAKLKKGELADAVKLGESINSELMPSLDGKYVYFFTGEANGSPYKSTLYVHKAGTAAPIMIDDNVDSDLSARMISKDGRTVYYIKNGLHKQVSFTIGELYSYTYGEESALISEDVVLYHSASRYRYDKLLTSGVSTDEFTYYPVKMLIDPESITYCKLIDTEGEYGVIVKWMHFNGEESSLIADGLILN